MNQNEKLSFKLKVGYGVGTLGESIAFSVFYFFFIIYLTTVVGLQPAVAGTISLIAVLWDGITDPVVGYLSDNSKNPKGRRRPFMLRFCVPLGIVTALLFTDWQFFSGTAKVAYFLIVNILFWMVFTATHIPYMSLGAELTDDYNERTQLRTFANIFNYAGVIVVSTGAIMLVGHLAGPALWTPDGAKAWSITASVLGALIIISFLITWVATKGHEKTTTAPAATKRPNFFKEYSEILKIAPYRYLLGYTLLVCMGIYSGTATIFLYFGFNLGLDQVQSGTLMLGYSMFVILLSPVVGFIASKIGKKNGMILFTAITAIISVTVWSLGTSMMATYLLLLGIAFVVCTFFIIAFSSAFDICEVDELTSGTRREGIIISFFSFTMKVGIAIGMWVAGLSLQYFGFDGAAPKQTVEAIAGIKTTLMILPAVFFFLSVIVVTKYPITEAKFKEMMVQLKNKRESQESV